MQEWLTLFVVALALGYLVWRWRGKKPAGAGCHGCSRSTKVSEVRSNSEPAR